MTLAAVDCLRVSDMRSYMNDSLFGFEQGELAYMIILNEDNSMTNLIRPSPELIKETLYKAGLTFEEKDQIMEVLENRSRDVYGFMLDINKFRENRHERPMRESY